MFVSIWVGKRLVKIGTSFLISAAAPASYPPWNYYVIRPKEHRKKKVDVLRLGG